MRLTDLQPRWITRDGRRVLFVFKCPHCPNSKTWLSLKIVPMKVSEQYQLISEQCEDLRDSGALSEVVATRKETAWAVTSEEFATMSVTPSVDASASGNWHGHITAGAIVGGL